MSGLTGVVVGIDPGATTGVAVLDLARPNEPEFAQLSPKLAVPMLNLVDNTSTIVRIALEKFVVSHRAGRLSTPQASAATRQLIADVITWGETHGVRVDVRAAAQVKPWATDERIKALGWYHETTSHGHARDALRHALYTACSLCGLADPLSRKGAQRG